MFIPFSTIEMCETMTLEHEKRRKIRQNAEMTGEHSQTHDETWARVIQRLRDRRIELREAFLAGFPTETRYGPDRVPIADVIEVIDDSMEMFLRLLNGTPLNDWLKTYPERIGSRRARQGIELDLLLTGVRTNFTVLWSGLREELEQEDPRLLVDKVDLLLSLVEQHISRVQRAHTEETARIARDTQYASDRALMAFLSQEDPSVDAIDAATSALGDTKPDEHWLALTFAPRARTTTVESGWSHAIPWQNTLVLLACGTASPPELPRGIEKGVLTRHPMPMQAVPRLARAMLRLTGLLRSADETVFLEELLMRELHTNAVARVGGAELLIGDGFRQIREVERERLLETFRTYYFCGSVSGTAEGQFCHRNTVVTRLRRVRELTGFDPYVPRDAAVLALAWGIE